MTLRHLYIFIAVYQEMSITKAAERLHLAQPRVSQAVKELEEEYGVRLFERLNPVSYTHLSCALTTKIRKYRMLY